MVSLKKEMKLLHTENTKHATEVRETFTEEMFSRQLERLNKTQR